MPGTGASVDGAPEGPPLSVTDGAEDGAIVSVGASVGGTGADVTGVPKGDFDGELDGIALPILDGE